MVATDLGAKRGHNHPEVLIDANYSYKDDRPVIMALVLYWENDPDL